MCLACETVIVTQEETFLLWCTPELSNNISYIVSSAVTSDTLDFHKVADSLVDSSRWCLECFRQTSAGSRCWMSCYVLSLLLLHLISGYNSLDKWFLSSRFGTMPEIKWTHLIREFPLLIDSLISFHTLNSSATYFSFVIIRIDKNILEVKKIEWKPQ